MSNLLHNIYSKTKAFKIQFRPHDKTNRKKIRSTMKVGNVKMFSVTQLAESGHTSIDPVSG